MCNLYTFVLLPELNVFVFVLGKSRRRGDCLVTVEAANAPY